MQDTEGGFHRNVDSQGINFKLYDLNFTEIEKEAELADTYIHQQRKALVPFLINMI